MTTERVAGAGLHSEPSRSPSGGARHIPVLLTEVLAVLTPKDGDTFIDGTFGAGGYATALLDAADCRVLGLDRDSSALAAGSGLVEHYAGRLIIQEARFGALEAAWMERFMASRPPPAPAPSSGASRHLLPTGEGSSVSPPFPSPVGRRWREPPDEGAGAGFDVSHPPSGIVLDIGVSSMQLDEADRGFSFMRDGPLDMRMSASGPLAGASAADLVATLDADPLADILYTYGDEKRSRAIARAIIAARSEAPITTTFRLAQIVERVLGRARDDKKHPATRTFQALRIAVNDELGELERALVAAERLLGPGGKLAVVTFHSLEDRIVKNFFRERTGNTPRGSRFQPDLAAPPAPSFQFINPKPISPSEAEVLTNPRARSAQLRAVQRTAAPAWMDRA
jgi:16S rRNA (cytosine1402-N4)-methyltransferase